MTLAVPGAYHVMQDEAAQLSTSLSMSAHKEIGMAQTGLWDRDQFFVTKSILGKRPFFQPFLVSLIHDFAGYRVQNARGLNFVLGLASLVSLYGILRFFLPQIPSVTAVLLTGATPIFLLAVNAYGFEAANFFFLSAYTFAVIWFLRHPDQKREAFLVLICATLAYLRYESVVLAIPAYIAILFYRREGRPLHFITQVSPLLYVPYAWLTRLSTSRVDNWQEISSGFGADMSPFGLNFLFPNLWSLVEFIANPTSLYPNNYPLFLLSLFGILALVLKLSGRNWIAGFERMDVFKPFALIFSAAFGLLVLIIVSYHWSSFTDPLAARMSIPLLIPMCLLASFALAWMRLRSPIWMLIPLAVFAVYSKPALTEYYIETADHRRAVETAKQAWLDSTSIDLKKTLVLDTKGVLFWTSNRVSSVRAEVDASQLERILLQHAAGRFDTILFVSEEYLGKGGAWGSRSSLSDQLGQPGEPVFRKNFSNSYRVSIYPVVFINKGKLFDMFWREQSGKTDSRAVYQAWELYLYKHLPSL